MKIIHILGRGIEGCGVTRFTLEMKDWALSKGYDYKIYATKDKRWTRASSHQLDEHVVEQKFGNKPARGDTLFGVDNIIADCNNADIVIIGSLPSKGHPADCIENFEKLLNSITSKVVMIQHDHKMMSIKRNALLDKAILRADVLFAYSESNPFMNYCRTLGAGGAMYNFCNGIDIEKIKSDYWKPIDEQDPKHLKWIGRSAYWKGFDVLFDLYETQAKGKDFLFTLEGMEKSIQFVDIRKRFDFNEMAEDFNAPTKYGEKPYIFGAYKHAEMLQRLSKCGFGFQLTYLQPEYIQNFIEFTHLEIVGVGVIPIFRKKYGDHCTHLKTGNLLTEDENSGTIWLNEVGGDHTKEIELITKLSNDSVMRDEWRNMAFEYYHSHNSPESSFGDFFEKVNRPFEKRETLNLESFFS
jgi:hypothetical protein